MENEEYIFDINKVLKKIFISLKNINLDKKIELIFNMHSTVPRKFKGDVLSIEKMLIKLLAFVYKNTTKNEIVLTINAPKDFIYEEPVSFSIVETGIVKEKILAFLETELDHLFTILDAKIIHDNKDIHLEIPFTISELGFRRHYRLPSKSMLQKRVLLIIESEKVTSSITKMFKYFPYDVDIGFKVFQNKKMDLSTYDVVVLENHLLDESFKRSMKEIKKKQKIKFVLLGEDNMEACDAVCACLIKPITQESIFELIVSLFSSESIPDKSIDRREEPRNTASKENVTVGEDCGSLNTDSLGSMIEKKKSEVAEILNIDIGLKNAEKNGTSYADELEIFLDIFDRSDLYFRQIVNEKQLNKIKEFCIDLEKQAKIIGAERMQKFTETVNRIFVYNKVDMLPIYPGRYHIELEKLIHEIDKYLGY